MGSQKALKLYSLRNCLKAHESLYESWNRIKIKKGKQNILELTNELYESWNRIKIKKGKQTKTRIFSIRDCKYIIS